ncbi:MAG: secretin N-terminal domain-containing protein [Chthoniobacteraceae bacterium]
MKTIPHFSLRFAGSFLIYCLLATGPMRAQAPDSGPVALPEPVAPAADKEETPPPIVPPVKGELKATIDRLEAAPASARESRIPVRSNPKPIVVPKDGLILNFKDAPLSEVLNHLSEAAGFVIVGDVPAGKVNIVSRQPISPDEAIALLNTVLVENGSVAIRNGRILKIVKRKGAEKLDIPVGMWRSRDPEEIPRRDEIVTQILPLRYGEAAKLVVNLEPLLADTATISANEGSNSIILTDTLSNIRRVAEIIAAVDTSVESISDIHVIPLNHADAKELATLVTTLYSTDAASSSNRGSRRGGFSGFSGFGGGRGGDRGGGDNSTGGDSEARKAVSRVVAVADEQSNSLVVSAPEDAFPKIAELVAELDTSITDVTESQIFRLQNADAVETAELITNLYGDVGDKSGSQNNQDDRRRGFGRDQQTTNNKSQRTLLQSKVVAVGDPRTNQILVTAARDTMMQIAEMVGRLDSSPAKRQRMFVYSLKNADPESVAEVLRGIVGDTTSGGTGSQSGGNVLRARTTSGANMDTSDFSASGGGGARGGGR